MKYLLAVIAAIFANSLVQILTGYRKNEEERLLKKRFQEIKKIRRYEAREVEDINKGIKLNLNWIRVPPSLEKDLKTSGLKVTSQELIVVWGMSAFIPPVLLLLLKVQLVTCVGISLVGAALPLLIIRRAKKKRVEKFQNQLGEALLIFSSTIRAGLTFERAMITVADGLPSPICEELLQTGNELRNGSPVETALDALAERMQSEDLKLVTSAVLIQKRVGGNLADILDNISTTIKDRITIQRNIRTLTSQGRISAQIIGALPIFLALTLSVIRFNYMEPLFQTDMGRISLSISIILELSGFSIMMKMTDIKY